MSDNESPDCMAAFEAWYNPLHLSEMVHETVVKAYAWRAFRAAWNRTPAKSEIDWGKTSISLDISTGEHDAYRRAFSNDLPHEVIDMGGGHIQICITGYVNEELSPAKPEQLVKCIHTWPGKRIGMACDDCVSAAKYEAWKAKEINRQNAAALPTPTPLEGAEREKAVIIRRALEMAERAVCDIESPDAQATYHAIAKALEAMKGGA
jgi:hypothetical protein